MRRTSPLRHEALRDTMWVGKGVRGIVILGIAAVAAAAWLLY
ncbi:hypothetical protein [Phenylobacterium sp.]|nr:hypothetical protein [Phenylobacterium sp.]